LPKKAYSSPSTLNCGPNPTVLLALGLTEISSSPVLDNTTLLAA